MARPREGAVGRSVEEKIGMEFAELGGGGGGRPHAVSFSVKIGKKDCTRMGGFFL